MKKFESPSPKDASCQFWLKLAQWFWRRRFFNFANVFSLFRNYLPLEKDQTWNPTPKYALCKIWLKLAQPFWRRRFFNLSMNLHYFVFISPRKKGGALHLKKHEFSSPKDALCQVWLNWLSGSVEENFQFRQIECIFAFS